MYVSLILFHVHSSKMSPFQPTARNIHVRYITPPWPDFNLTCAIKRDQKRISVWSVGHFFEQKCARALTLFFITSSFSVTTREHRSTLLSHFIFAPLSYFSYFMSGRLRPERLSDVPSTTNARINIKWCGINWILIERITREFRADVVNFNVRRMDSYKIKCGLAGIVHSTKWSAVMAKVI